MQKAVCAKQQRDQIVRYAIWNNKGGVGKSFLTFAIATETAHKYPHRQVVIIDMCPQANSSEITLGGNGTGSKLLAEKISEGRTIPGYFYQRMDRSAYNKLGTEKLYCFQVSSLERDDTRDRKCEIPNNVHLIAGGPEVELQITDINRVASAGIPDNAWIKVHRWVEDLIHAAQADLGDDTVFFIDCNPSFSVYTEIGLVASERVIVPCTPDGASARAIANVGKIVVRLSVEYQA